MGALGGVGEGDAEESEENHARYKGDLSTVLVGNVPHKGVCNYAYGLQERCVDPDFEGGKLEVFSEVDGDEGRDDVIAHGAKAREDDHGDKGPVLQQNAGGGEILLEGGDTLLALEIPESKPHQYGGEGCGDEAELKELGPGDEQKQGAGYERSEDLACGPSRPVEGDCKTNPGWESGRQGSDGGGMPEGYADAEKNDGNGDSEISLHSTGCEVANSYKGQGNGEDYGPLAAEAVGEEAGGHCGDPGRDVSCSDQGAGGEVGQHEAGLDLREDDHEGGGVEVLKSVAGDRGCGKESAAFV